MSCSAFGTEGSGPSLVWSVPSPDNLTVGRRGGADASHFYAVRGERAPLRLTAFRHSDGTVAWAAPVSNVCSPVVAAEGRVFCPSDRLHAFDAASGQALWTFEPAATLQLTEGAAGGGRVFAGAFEYGRADRSIAYGLDAATGAVLWSRRLEGPGWTWTWLRAFTLDEGAPGGPELLVSLEACYSANCYLSASAIVALDPATGRERWRFQDGDGTDDRKIGGVTVYRGPGAGPAGLLLYADAHGRGFVAVDRATRTVRYRVPVRPGFLGPLRPPLVVDGIAYAGWGDEQVYAFDAATGALRWAVQPDRGTNRNYEVCGPYVLANNDAMAVVERATGRGRGVLIRSGSEYATQTAVWEDRLFVATNRAAYAFDCR